MMKYIGVLCLLLAACANPVSLKHIGYYRCGSEIVLIRQMNDESLYLSAGEKQLVLNRSYRTASPRYTDITGHIIWEPRPSGSLLQINNDVYPLCFPLRD